MGSDQQLEAVALRRAAMKALNYIENTESELGVTLDSGDALRAALTIPPPSADDDDGLRSTDTMVPREWYNKLYARFDEKCRELNETVVSMMPSEAMIARAVHIVLSNGGSGALPGTVDLMEPVAEYYIERIARFAAAIRSAMLTAEENSDANGK